VALVSSSSLSLLAAGTIASTHSTFAIAHILTNAVAGACEVQRAELDADQLLPLLLLNWLCGSLSKSSAEHRHIRAVLRLLWGTSASLEATCLPPAFPLTPRRRRVLFVSQKHSRVFFWTHRQFDRMHENKAREYTGCTPLRGVDDEWVRPRRLAEHQNSR
jgi:hypothetical protein